MLSKERRSRQKESSGTESKSITVTVSGGGASTTGEYSKSEQGSEAEEVGHLQTQIRGGGLLIKTEGDAVVKGADVVVKELETDIKGQLRVESEQDEQSTKSSGYNYSVGSNMGYGINESKSTKKWVTSQTRLIGSETATIKANKVVNKGGLIANAELEKEEGPEKEEGKKSGPKKETLKDKGQLNWQVNEYENEDMNDESDSHYEAYGINTGASGSASQMASGSQIKINTGGQQHGVRDQ